MPSYGKLLQDQNHARKIRSRRGRMESSRAIMTIESWPTPSSEVTCRARKTSHNYHTTDHECQKIRLTPLDSTPRHTYLILTESQLSQKDRAYTFFPCSSQRDSSIESASNPESCLIFVENLLKMQSLRPVLR